jgi:hypothetical protein
MTERTRREDSLALRISKPLLMVQTGAARTRAYRQGDLLNKVITSQSPISSQNVR